MFTIHYIHFYITIGLIVIFKYYEIKEYVTQKFENMSYRKVYISSDKNIYIKGKITKKLIDETINKIDKIKSKNINLIINSGGGDLMAGCDLINKMSTLQKELITTFNCYAINAKSTAFNIFQFCNKRYVIPTSVLLQHNPTIQFNGTFEQFEDFYENRFEFYRLTFKNLNKIISKKIKLEYKIYMDKIRKEWNIKGGHNIIKNNLADEIVIILDLEYPYKI